MIICMHVVVERRIIVRAGAGWQVRGQDLLLQVHRDGAKLDERGGAVFAASSSASSSADDSLINREHEYETADCSD